MSRLLFLLYVLDKQTFNVVYIFLNIRAVNSLFFCIRAKLSKVNKLLLQLLTDFRKGQLLLAKDLSTLYKPSTLSTYLNGQRSASEVKFRIKH